MCSHASLSQYHRFREPLRSQNQPTDSCLSRTKEISELAAALNRLSITIRSHEQNLSDRMAQNQTILDNLADGILVIDSDGSIRSCNVATSRILPVSIRI